jgi:hypothetical protein
METDETSLAPVSETVFTVACYYDGPRQNIANYQGAPHFYEWLFEEGDDEYFYWYQLTPIDEPTFRLAMEDWAIWRKWQAAFHEGKAALSSHPALPEDRARHEELQLVLCEKLVTDPDRAITRIGKFEAVNPGLPKGVPRDLRVKWSLQSDRGATTG